MGDSKLEQGGVPEQELDGSEVSSPLVESDATWFAPRVRVVLAAGLTSVKEREDCYGSKLPILAPRRNRPGLAGNGHRCRRLEGLSIRGLAYPLGGPSKPRLSRPQPLAQTPAMRDTNSTLRS